MKSATTIADLAAVIYSAGRVFDGLAASRLDTENFLRTGSLHATASRADCELLQDLRDAAQFIIDHAGAAIDGAFVCALNATITRSGALHPGQLRAPQQSIGVATPYGRHTPAPLTATELQAIVQQATLGHDPCDNALDLFLDIAAAQPFEDANKRTAVFAANSLLINTHTGILLTVPVDDHDSTIAATFHQLLAQAYVHGNREHVKALLATHGLTAHTTSR